MKYNAFISYRHADLDLYVAKSLHRGLETFKVPRTVAKKFGKKNIKRVFRDQEELPIGSDLGNNIEAALAESEFLIVVCSPRTLKSYWVQKEISTFIEMHDREHVLAVLIEGEPNESFPKALLEDENGNPVEPLAADVRGTTKRECSRKMRTEIMRLAAPLLGCSYDDLKQRHRERRMKRIIAACTTVAATALLFGAYSTYNAAMIQQNLEGKQRNQSKYLADTSLSLLEEGDRRAAVLVALEALPTEENDRPYVAEAQYALSKALYCYDTGTEVGMDLSLQHDLPVRDFCMYENGTKIVSVDQGEQIYLWDVETGAKLAQIGPRVGENGYIERPEGAMVCGDSIIICEEDILRSLNYAGEEEWCVESPSAIIGCKFHEQTKMVACISSDKVFFYDITNGQKIAEMSNGQEASFTFDMAYNADGTKFAVAHYIGQESAQGLVSVYDFDTDEVTTLPVAGAYIAELAFASDERVVVSSCDYGDDFADMSGKSGYIEKIDINNQEVLWSNTFEYPSMGIDSTSVRLKCREYEDKTTGEIHSEVITTVNNRAITYESETGEVISDMSTESGIVNLLISVQSGYGYLAGGNGNIDIVDLTKNSRFPSSSIRTGKELKDAQIQNGVVVLRAYASPALTLMKYHEAAEMEMLHEFEDTVSDVEYSENETYYAVRTYGMGNGESILFYRTEDNAFVEEWHALEEGNALEAGFTDDERYMIVRRDGVIVYHNVETGEDELLETADWQGFLSCDRKRDSFLLAMYDGMWYCVVDLQKGEILTEGELNAQLHGGIPSDDGKYIYCSAREQGVCEFDTESGTLTPIGGGEYSVLSNGEVNNAFALSENGKLLAVGCWDGILRVFDLEARETVAEIPFAGVNRRFIAFIREDTQIMLQGDDYYFRVYDLENDEFIHISTDQYYEIETIVIDEETDTISLTTIADMVILNRADYERSAQIDCGMAYLPKHARILCVKWGEMYQFPYMTLEALRDAAAVQFAGETLTRSERTRFHVD